MSVKAKLSVILKANDVIVAEVEDGQLWQQILTAINAGTSDIGVARAHGAAGIDMGAASGVTTSNPNLTSAGGDGPVGRLSQQLGLSSDIVEGACSPSSDSPYMHLDSHCWENMKRQLPDRGSNAIAPIVAVGTLLALWFRSAGLGNPTQAQAQAVLETIGLRDKNPGRGIARASWLQSRPGGQIQLNPAQISRATTLAKSFCSGEWADWKQMSVD